MQEEAPQRTQEDNAQDQVSRTAEESKATAVREERLKLVVVGDATVGKNSLLHSYNTGRFNGDQVYISATYDNYTATHTTDGVSYTLLMWRTGGQEEYSKLRRLTYPGTHVFLLCFALDNRASFYNVSSKWVPELHKHCPKTPIVLVGTKMDVTGPDVVTPRDGMELAERHRLSQFVQCSAKTREGLQEVFDAAVRAAVAPVSKGSRRCLIM